MKTSTKRRVLFRRATVFALTLPFIFSCERPGEKVAIPTEPAPTVEFLVEEGWIAYENQDYREAKSLFITAVNRDVFNKEAYVGLGWTFNRLFDYNNAVPRFDLLLTLVTEADMELEFLAYAGKALSYMGLNSDSLACLQAKLYLETADDDYRFDHDARISTGNVKKLLLNGYWNYQDFYNVQKTITNHFEPSWFDNLIGTDDNLEEIDDEAASITVEIDVDTTVVPYDTTIVVAKIVLADRYNLLEVTGIIDTLSVTYPLRKFAHGGNVIHIDSDALEEVSMLLDDFSQPVNVDFTTSQDYGKYITTLMAKMQSLY